MAKSNTKTKPVKNTKKDKILKEYAEYINPSRVRILKSAGLDLVEARREGPYVWDVSGKKYIDCMTGAGSFNVGRRNPKMIQALQEGLKHYDIGNFLFFSEIKVELAKKLASISPGKALKCVTYGSGGGEVNDFAIKLARGYTMKTKVISLEKGYHGHTGFSLSGIGRDAYQKPFLPLMPEFERVPLGDIGGMERAMTDRTACVILEPILGEGGIFIPPDGYLAAVRELCDKRGVLMIADEIQTGWGRTGKMFCMEHSGVIPDIMTVGKSLSGGLYPIAAAVYKEELQDFLFTNPFIHFSTFGGSDLGCAVALAAIDFIQKKKLPENAEKMGKVFEKGLTKLLTKYSDIFKEFRRKGLMIGLQYANEAHGPRMSLELSKRGVVAVFSGNDPRVMRLMPSLVINKSDVAWILKALDESMLSIQKGGTHG